jgi:uncharacterized protein
MREGSIRLPRSGFVWHELMSTDPKQSEAYLMLMVGDQPVGGVAGPRPDREGWPSGGPDAHWIAYFGTDDVNKAASTAQELGGEVLLPPTDVPGMGRAAVLRDPQGAAFGVFASES